MQMQQHKCIHMTFDMLCKQSHGMGQVVKHLVMVVRMLLQTGRAERSQQ